MPELLLHFSIPFAITVPIVGLRRALLVGFIAILPDIDALVHVHRSFTHSIILISILAALFILISWKIGKGLLTVTACGLSLLSHPILDLFQSPTPILYPLSEYSYQISIKMSALISEKIIPEVSAKVSFEQINFTRFQFLDAPIFTDVGFITSLMLIASPTMYHLIRTLRYTSSQEPLGQRYDNKLNKAIDVDAAEGCQDASTTPQPHISKDDVTILIPTLNEEEAIGRVIEEVREAGYNNILVVDGYSSDKTVEIARSMGAKIVYQIGHGKSMAIKTGIEAAQTRYVLVMDGDGTYDPRDIDRLLEVALENDYDEVIGYRADRKNIPPLHRLGNRIISTVISLLMGQRIKDPCSGMYLLKRDFARQLEITSTGFDIEAEIVCQALTHGNVGEVPIRYRKRIGRAKLKTLSAGFRIILTAFKLSWLYSPVLLFSSIGSILGLGGLAILLQQLYLRYIFGERAWSVGWTWLGLVLLMLGLQSFTIAIITLMLKRLERRLVRLFIGESRPS